MDKVRCSADPADGLGPGSRLRSPLWNSEEAEKRWGGGTRMFHTGMEGAEPSQTGKRVVGGILDETRLKEDDKYQDAYILLEDVRSVQRQRNVLIRRRELRKDRLLASVVWR